MPVQDPDALYAKPCAVNPYAGAAFQQCQKFLTPFQAPKSSYAKSLCLYRLPKIQIIAYAREASRQRQHFLMQVQAPDASPKSLCLCRFSTIQRISYARAAFQQFTRKSLHLYRFLTLHTHILMLVQVPNISDHSLHLGSLPKNLKILCTTKINSL
ncbi:hypothetical protein O181_119929 [Austropuccinia psidii MF-1]|uniref:Uncharacterized protein n=1 Tax=Austropuccinia psidii MF-1 TaxID=1389203 RepID=A0A9Q3KFN9_9BASI|nr:hypothetical protein [Austropuccinia psidii MF-1]